MIPRGMESSFCSADMLRRGLAQFYSQAIEKQTFQLCQVTRNTKKKRKSVKVTGIFMQSTASAVLKKQNQTQGNYSPQINPGKE